MYGLVDRGRLLSRDPEAAGAGAEAAVVEDPHAHVVEEDERLAVDRRAAGAVLELPRLHVPGAEHARVGEVADALEAPGPVVEVLLIAHLPVLVAREAPLDAALPPPVERREAAAVGAEGHELDDVEAGAPGEPPRVVLRRGGGGGEQDGAVAECREERLRRGEEAGVRVEVGELVEPVALDQPADDAGSRGPQVLDGAALGAGRGERGVGGLELGERDRLEGRQAELAQHPVRDLVEADSLEVEIAAVLEQRSMESERSGQVVDVDVGAVIALHVPGVAAQPVMPRARFVRRGMPGATLRPSVSVARPPLQVQGYRLGGDSAL